MKYYFKNLLLGISILVTCMFIIEISLRILGYKPYSNHTRDNSSEIINTLNRIDLKKPMNIYDVEDKYNKDTNVHIESLSTIKYSYKVRPNGSRYSGVKYNNKIPDINIYGCSFTFGLGLNDTSTQSYFLQKMIPNYNINNFGQPGYGMCDIYYKIKRTLDSNTKIIIINYAHFLTDRLPGSRYDTKIKNSTITTDLKEYLKKNVVITIFDIGNSHSLIDKQVPFPIYNLIPFQNISASINLIDDLYNNSYERKKLNKIEYTYLILKEINKLCIEKKIKLIVTNINDYKKTKSDLEYFKRIGFQIVNLGVNTDDKKYNLYPFDTHPNELANKLFANRLLSNISSIIKNK
jgi:hypothetical protein